MTDKFPPKYGNNTPAPHTGPEPTHDSVEKMVQNMVDDDLATREAELTKARGNASAHDITGQQTPDTVKPR